MCFGGEELEEGGEIAIFCLVHMVPAVPHFSFLIAHIFIAQGLGLGGLGLGGLDLGRGCGMVCGLLKKKPTLSNI
jgi:hypothetical protein